MTEMVPEDDGGHIPAIYRDFVEVFSRALVETLPPHQSTDHAVDLEPGYNLPYGRIYNTSEFELRMERAYIEANLATIRIQQSSWPMVAPMSLQKRRMEG